MEFTVIFDEAFFENAKTRWLKTKEIFLLLGNIPELIENDLLCIWTLPKPQPESGDYFLIFKKDLISWMRPLGKDSTSELKVNGIGQIICIYSIIPKLGLKRRIYYLKTNPKYAFVHYLSTTQQEIEDKQFICGRQSYENNSAITYVNQVTIESNFMKIVDFAPEAIEENSESAKMLLVVESYLNYQNLKMLENQMTIKFGEVSTSCTVLSCSTISAMIPSQRHSDVVIELYIGADKVSYYATPRSFKYTQNKSKYSIQPSHDCENTSSFLETKSCASIFRFTQEEIQKKIVNLLNRLVSLLVFYSNVKVKDINLSILNDNFNQDSLYTCIDKMITELENIQKLHLMSRIDENGYSLVHYICAINYPSILELMYKNKISLCELSQNRLTAYEISAGKSHLECLQKLIELIDTHDNDEMFDFHFGEKEKIFYSFDILKSALNIALEKKNIELSDIKVLDLLLKQIKIKYTVDSSMIIANEFNLNFHIKLASDSIIHEINNKCSKENRVHTDIFFSNEGNCVKTIQKFVRGWLRRSKYNGIKKAAKKLRESKYKPLIFIELKIFSERKKFLNIKHSAIFIQKKIRTWLKEKHKS